MSTALKSPSGVKITGCGIKDLSLAVSWKIKLCRTNTPHQHKAGVCVCGSVFVCVSVKTALFITSCVSD